MTANPDFDAEKAAASTIRSNGCEWCDGNGWFNSMEHLGPCRCLTGQLRAEVAALSHRPAGEVGKLVEELRNLGDYFKSLSAWDNGRVLFEAADALTALPSVGELSSAPVDAGVASAVEKLKRLSYGPEDPRRIVANMLESLSRQNAELRQAWAKVRAEIDGLRLTGPEHPGLMLDAVQAILAQHTPRSPRS